MATDGERERIGRAASAGATDLSGFVIHHTPNRDPLPPQVLRRAVPEVSSTDSPYRAACLLSGRSSSKDWMISATNSARPLTPALA